MNTRHYEKVKSTCQFLQSIDRNGAWNKMYEQWEEMDTQDRLTELEYLQTTLTEYIDNEHDAVYLNRFESELADIRKVEHEILGGIDE